MYLIEMNAIEENVNRTYYLYIITVLFSDDVLPSNDSYVHQHCTNDNLNGDNYGKWWNCKKVHTFRVLHTKSLFKPFICEQE